MGDVMTIDNPEEEPAVLRARICTCCRPARIIDHQDATWVHVIDATEALTLHAHHEQTFTCTDGPREATHVTRPNSTHRVVDGDEFQRASVQWMPSWYKAGGVLMVEQDGAYWRAPTEEGGETHQVTWCLDPDCAYPDSWQRDVFANEMGY